MVHRAQYLVLSSFYCTSYHDNNDKIMMEFFHLYVDDILILRTNYNNYDLINSPWSLLVNC